jgi:cyclase
MIEASWSRHYRFEEVGDGTYAAIVRPDGNSICNANSHWHLDHTLGNQEFSSVPIWATRRTREILLEKRDELALELTRKEIEKGLLEIEAERGKRLTEDARTDLDWIAQINRAVLSEIDNLRLTPPSHSVDSRLPLPGDREAELVSFGSGHTEADAFLFLPKERILFAGDLVVVGLQPSMGSGDPDHWLVVLDQMERLRVERLVPGHGPVVGVEGISETRGYVSGVLEAASAPAGHALPAAIRRWEGSLSLDWNLKFARDWVANRPTKK